LSAWFCVHCGSQDLTDPAVYLRLGWLVRLLAGIGLDRIIRRTCFHGVQIAESLRAIVEWGIGCLSGRDPRALEKIAFRAAGIFLGSLLLLTLLPGSLGRYLWEVARRWLAFLRILHTVQRLLRGRG